MTKLVRNFLNGLGDALVIAPNRGYVRPQARGFQIDVALLRRDIRVIGDGIKTKMKQADDGKSVYNR